MAVIIDGGFNPFAYPYNVGSTSVFNKLVEHWNNCAQERVAANSFSQFFNISQTGLFKIGYYKSNYSDYRFTATGSVGSLKGPYPANSSMSQQQEYDRNVDRLRAMYVKLYNKNDLATIKKTLTNRYVYELDINSNYGYVKYEQFNTQYPKSKILNKIEIGNNVADSIISLLDSDDYVCIYNIDSLDNDNDGNYSELNPRNKRTDIDNISVGFKNQVINSVFATPIQYSTSGITSGYPVYLLTNIDFWRNDADSSNIFNFNQPTPVGDSSITNTNTHPVGNQQALCGFLPYNLKIILASNTNYGNVGDIVNVANPNFIFWKKDDLTDFLNKIGIPWTYSYEEFQFKNTNEFTDYKPEGGGGEKGEGQEENQIDVGGGGDGDNSSDTFQNPIPTLSTINGLNGNYAMTMAQLKSFKEYLWSQDFLDVINPFNSDPSKNIIGVTMYPFDIVQHDPNNTAPTTAIIVGNVDISKSAYLINSAYRCVLNLGELDLKEYYGNFLDYGNFTKLQLYIPYSGFTELSANDVMGKKLKVTMAIDIVSGSGVAMIYANDVIYKIIPVALGVSLPVSSSDETENGIKFATNIIGAIGSIASGNASGAVSSAVSIANQNVNIDKGTAQSPFANWFMPQDCYLIITRPKYSEPPYYTEINGKPSFWGGRLGDCEGFTVVANPVIDFDCTETERQLLIDTLQKGIRI